MLVLPSSSFYSSVYAVFPRSTFCSTAKFASAISVIICPSCAVPDGQGLSWNRLPFWWNWLAQNKPVQFRHSSGTVVTWRQATDRHLCTPVYAAGGGAGKSGTASAIALVRAARVAELVAAKS